MTHLTLTKSSIFGSSSIIVCVSVAGSTKWFSSVTVDEKLVLPSVHPFFSSLPPLVCLSAHLRGRPHPIRPHQSDQLIWICLCLPCLLSSQVSVVHVLLACHRWWKCNNNNNSKLYLYSTF